MKIHKEGYKILVVLAIILAAANAIVFWLVPNWLTFSYIVTGVLFLLVLQFSTIHAGQAVKLLTSASFLPSSVPISLHCQSLHSAFVSPASNQDDDS